MDSDVNCSVLSDNEAREYISFSWYCEGILQVGNLDQIFHKVALSPDIMSGSLVSGKLSCSGLFYLTFK